MLYQIFLFLCPSDSTWPCDLEPQSYGVQTSLFNPLTQTKWLKYNVLYKVPKCNMIHKTVTPCGGKQVADHFISDVEKVWYGCFWNIRSFVVNIQLQLCHKPNVNAKWWDIIHSVHSSVCSLWCPPFCSMSCVLGSGAEWTGKRTAKLNWTPLWTGPSVTLEKWVLLDVSRTVIWCFFHHYDLESLGL